MTAAGILFFSAAMLGVVTSIPLLGTLDPETAKEQAFNIYPLLGAILSAAGICLLHNVSEGKKVIAGRIIFALLMGFVGPWLTELLYPPIADKLSDLRAQMLLGVVYGGIGYILSRAFVERFFKSAPAIADKQVGDIEQKYGTRKKDDL